MLITLYRSRERDRDRETEVRRSDKEIQKEKELDEEMKERKKLDRKAREKEAAYQVRSSANNYKLKRSFSFF